MKGEFENMVLLDRYLNGELDLETAKSVEEKIASDPAFAELAELTAMTNEVVLGAKLHDLRTKVKEDLVNIDRKRSIRNQFFVWSVVALITGIVLWWMVGDKTSTSDTGTVVISRENTAGKNTNLPQSTGIIKGNNTIQRASGDGSKKKSSVAKIESNEILPEPFHDRSAGEVPEEIQEQISVVHPSPSDTILKRSSVRQSPCDTTTIKATAEIIPNCITKNSAEVIIKKVHGGQPPYVFQIDQEPVQSYPAFEHVPRGNHQYTVQDQHDCMLRQSFIVQEFACPAGPESFNPDAGETWKFPEGNGTLTIYNRTGRTVYQTNIRSAGFWDGRDLQGTIVPAGIYLYTMESIEGHKNVSGEVTVIR